MWGFWDWDGGTLPARRKYKKPRPSRKRRVAITPDRKAHSMQGSWRKNTGTTLTIDDAKGIIKEPPICPYCKVVIPWQQLSLDHVQPKSRDGANTPENMVWSCSSCNLMKSDLTGAEYQLLLDFLRGYPKMMMSVLTRLRMAGAAFGKFRRYR